MLEDESLPRGNNTLHKNIANKAFNKFIQLLSSKTKVIRIDSKECYRCGNIHNIPLDKRIFKCNKCGLVIDRDRNSTLNILKDLNENRIRMIEVILPYPRG